MHALVIGAWPSGISAARPLHAAGHGPLRWTLACGSDKLIADPMAGQRSDLEPTPFAPTRFPEERP